MTKPTIIEDILRVGGSHLIVISLGLVVSILTARYIGPEGNGLIASLTVYPSLFMAFGSLGVRQSITYFLGKNIFSEQQIRTAITHIWIMITPTSLIICFIIMYNFSNSGSNLTLVILALLPIPFTLFNTFSSGIFLGNNDIKYYNKVNWIPSLVVFLGVLLFIVTFNFGVRGAMLASVGGPMVMSIVLIVRNYRSNDFFIKFDWSIIQPMLSLGIVYATALLVINLNYKIDIILLDSMSNSHELGIYSKGALLAEYFWKIPAVLSTVIFARSAVSKHEKYFSLHVAQLLRVSFVIVIIVALLVFLFSKWIVVCLYGIKFYESETVLNLLLPGVVILTVFKVMNMDLAGKAKPWIALKAMVPALIVNVVLNIVMIPRFGADGAAIASTLSYSLAGLLFLGFYSKAVNLSIRDIIRYKSTDFQPIFNFLRKLKRF